MTAFDSGDYWSPQKGVASSVLLFLQSRLEESGQMFHSLSFLILQLYFYLFYEATEPTKEVFTQAKIVMCWYLL